MTSRLWQECLGCQTLDCKDCIYGENMVVDNSKKVTDLDPNGVKQHDAGAKLDAGKPMVGLVLGGFADALVDVAKVGTFGATKYSPNGWKEVEGGEQRYMDAAFRHLFKHLGGEIMDEDSGCTHLSQVAWNVLAVIEFTKQNPCLSIPPPRAVRDFERKLNELAMNAQWEEFNKMKGDK